MSNHLTVDAVARPAMDAHKLVPTRFREATNEARGWLEDCYGSVLPDGRRTALLAAVDIWLLISRLYTGAVEGFIEDGQYVVTEERVLHLVTTL